MLLYIFPTWTCGAIWLWSNKNVTELYRSYFWWNYSQTIFSLGIVHPKQYKWFQTIPLENSTGIEFSNHAEIESTTITSSHIGLLASKTTYSVGLQSQGVSTCHFPRIGRVYGVPFRKNSLRSIRVTAISRGFGIHQWLGLRDNLNRKSIWTFPSKYG